MRRLSWVVLVLALTFGCKSGGVDLFVDVRSDLAPGREFDSVETELLPGSPGMTGVTVLARAVVNAEAGDAYADGVRVAMFGGVARGRRTIMVRLFDDEGRLVMSRAAVVELRQDLVATVIMARDCLGVVCPGVGDDPDAIACLGGRCVNPECLPETPGTCPGVECGQVADCAGPASCAEALCASGVCLFVPDDAQCAAELVCHPTEGCIADPVDGVDGGGVDARGMDGGGADSGGPDAGRGFDGGGSDSGPVDGGGADGGGVDASDGGAPVPPGTVATFGSPDPDLMFSIAVDAAGNRYGAGLFRNRVDFGCADSLVSAGMSDAFVVKLAPDGTCLWARSFGGAENDMAVSLALAPNGNVAIAGGFMGTVTFDATTGDMFTSRRLLDFFVTYLTADGDYLFTRSVPGRGDMETWDMIDVAVAPDGTTFFGGRFEGADDFGWGGVSDLVDYSNIGDVFLTRMTADGTYIDTFSFGGGGSDRLLGMLFDPDGNLYIGGNIRGTDDVDPGPATLNVSGNHDGYVIKYDMDMNALWAVTSGINGWAPYYGFGLNPAGDRVFTVRFNAVGPGFLEVQSIETATGIVEWLVPISGTVIPSTMATDSTGGIYIVGEWSGTVDFDPGPGDDTRTSTGMQDAFVIRFEQDGSVAWTTTFGGTGTDRAHGLAVLGENDLLVSGEFQGTVDLSSIGVNALMTTNGGTDAFLVRLQR